MTRKPFNPTTGKHTTKQPTLPSVDEIYEPLVDVWGEPCPICEAKPTEPCHNIVGPQGESVYPHYARIEAARGKR
jgi:hypothetical protein